jgi:hypothetical protein
MYQERCDMTELPDKSAQRIKFLIALLGIALALVGWYRFFD